MDVGRVSILYGNWDNTIKEHKNLCKITFYQGILKSKVVWFDFFQKPRKDGSQFFAFG